MRPVVCCVGKPGHPWAEPAVQDYARRLRRWDGIEDRWIKPERFRGDADAVRAAESGRVLATVTPRDTLVALDERGQAVDTDGFRALIEAARLDGVTRLIFAIGGAYGHAPSLRDRADRTVQLSRLVLNHEVARIVLYEQIYRSYAAMNGVPYHH